MWCVGKSDMSRIIKEHYDDIHFTLANDISCIETESVNLREWFNYQKTKRPKYS
jgi:hypothetical protein